MKKILRRCRFVLVALTFVMLTMSCGSKSKVVKNRVINNIEFVSNIDYTLTEVIEMAAAQDKKVFVDFYADWCLPCKILDEEVFSQKPVYSYFNKNFINYKVDIEKANGANLKLMYGAEELPTLLFLNEKGSVVNRNDGELSVSYIMSMARTISAD